MSKTAQALYFRVKENGAMVFRIEAEDRNRRTEMTHVANVNVWNGKINPHGGEALDPAEQKEIEAWMAARHATLEDRDVADALRVTETLNETAHWAQSKATDAQLEQVTEQLLMSMHDLRMTLVRKMSERNTLEKAS